MKSLCISILLTSAAFAADPPAQATTSMDAAVEAYERLSTVIIEVRRTEDSVVKTIIIHHHQTAQEHLQAAQGGKDVLKHLEAAASEVTNAANEGDKRVQAIRQRLAKAGHTQFTISITGRSTLRGPGRLPSSGKPAAPGGTQFWQFCEEGLIAPLCGVATTTSTVE